jgi:hypothetical protein
MIVADVIILNEPTAALRVLAVRLVDEDGDPLALAHAFVAGDVKISKAGAAFVTTANLPTPIADGQAGSFNLQLELAEVDTVGKYRVQFTDDGEFLEEIFFDVRAAASVDVNAVVAAIFAHVADADAPEDVRTFQEQWNALIGRELGDGDGIDGPQFSIKGLDGVKVRAAGTVQSGKRRYTTRDGT